MTALPSTPRTLERHLRLAGTYNVRDVGGYATADGRRVRWRTLFRADSLHRLSATAQTALIDYGLRTVIDLRRGLELTEAPNVFVASSRVRYVHVPVLEDPTTGTPRERPALRTLEEIYRYAVETRGRQLTGALGHLADVDALPALAHCTAGKDRTGLVIALVLAALGVPDEVIAEDYALSADFLIGDYFEEARARAEARGIPWDEYQERLVCPPPLMLDTLGWLRERYGGVDDYLVQHGLPERDLATLRERLLEI